MQEAADALPNEPALITRALKEPSAFADLYDAYVGRIYTYVRLRVDDAATADDLVAQIFEQALVNLKHYQTERAPFIAWLFGIAHHVVSHHHRSQRRRHMFSLSAVLLLASAHPLPEEIVIENETQAELLLAFTKLREHERNLISLKFVAGLNNRQIAAITGKSEGSIGITLFRAMKKLRNILSE